MDVMLPDRAQVLVGGDPHVGVHRLVKLLNVYCSHALRAEFLDVKRRLPSWWTNGRTNRYFVSAVGGVTLETLKRCVESQKGQ